MRQPMLIAYHLTQFHPIPENDAWWGAGFTEWTNVRRGRPMYPGHRQPHRPGELGYYDLRDESVRAAQAVLARRYGVDGFCYYYYWFGGKRLLEQPVEAMLGGGAPDLPFCLCWANENWTRRWDGKDHQVLISQNYSVADDIGVIRDLIRHFRDPRYIRVQGKPLVIVYRLDLHPDPAGLVTRWRAECRRTGIGEIFLCTVRRADMPNPRKLGLDATVDFPPYGAVAAEITRSMESLDPEFRGRIFDYLDLVRDALSRRSGSFPSFPGVLPSWDNTARRGEKAHIYAGGTPLRYRAWLAEAIRRASCDPALPVPLVFINAWNEWAEGCHLEPDSDFGLAWLEATKAARADAELDRRLWTEFGTRLPALSISAERSLASLPLSRIDLTALNGGQVPQPPTPIERLFAAARRAVEMSPRVRRAVLPVARWLGLAD